MADKDKELALPKKKTSRKGARFSSKEAVHESYLAAIDLTDNIRGGIVMTIITMQENRVVEYSHPRIDYIYEERVTEDGTLRVTEDNQQRLTTITRGYTDS